MLVSFLFNITFQSPAKTLSMSPSPHTSIRPIWQRLPPTNTLILRLPHRMRWLPQPLITRSIRPSCPSDRRVPPPIRWSPPRRRSTARRSAVRPPSVSSSITTPANRRAAAQIRRAHRSQRRHRLRLLLAAKRRRRQRHRRPTRRL